MHGKGCSQTGKGFGRDRIARLERCRECLLQTKRKGLVCYFKVAVFPQRLRGRTGTGKRRYSEETQQMKLGIQVAQHSDRGQKKVERDEQLLTVSAESVYVNDDWLCRSFAALGSYRHPGQ